MQKASPADAGGAFFAFDTGRRNAMCKKCMTGVALVDATHMVMSSNRHHAVTMWIIEHGIDDKMKAFREEHKGAGDVHITLCACEAGANDLIATIKTHFHQWNWMVV